MSDVVYARAFFDLQLQFAGRVSAVSGLPMARALLEYTNLYVRFGLGRAFDPAHPVWQEYVAGWRDPNDAGERTHRFYLTRSRAVPPPGLVAKSGCFSYSSLTDGRIRLHFVNAETDGHSPLAIERRDRRVADLAVLFDHMKRTMREPPRVVGASWLYNLEAYRRLFPKSYVATARVLYGRFQHMPLWGQFVDRHGEVNEPLAQQLLQRLERQVSLEGLDQCFPFQVLTAEASALEFYECYGL